jgi:hypothetical protein
MIRRGSSGGEIVVREIVQESGGGGSGKWPMLTKTNYTEWAILMQVQLHSAILWDDIDTGDATARQELGAIL